MNWLEIDKILYGIIERHSTEQDVIEEARKQFKWSQIQAESAVKPLLKRHSDLKPLQQPAKSRSKRVTKTKKQL